MRQVCLPPRTQNIERTKLDIFISKCVSSSDWNTKNYGVSLINAYNVISPKVLPE